MSSYPNAVSPTANGNQWSSVVIEDLLVREFLNGENVAHLVPPTPSTTTTTTSNNNTGAESDTIPAANPAKQLREANKAFVRYLRGGGISWTASGTPSAVSATPNTQFPSPAIKSTPATPQPYHKSPSPTPNSSAAANQQHRSFPLQQQGGAYNAPTPTSAPTVPTSPANGLVPMKSPHGTFPLSSSAVNTQHSPKNNNANTFGNGGASNNKMALTVTKPGGAGTSSSMFPNQQSQQNLPYSTVMGAVAGECSRVHTNFPSNIPNNTALSTGKRRPHDDLVRARIHAQDTIDPDLIFAQPRDDFPLEHIFRGYPKVLAKMAETRGMSGDWIADTFTLDEEMKYKEDMGYTALGLSQTNSSFFASGM